MDYLQSQMYYLSYSVFATNQLAHSSTCQNKKGSDFIVETFVTRIGFKPMTVISLILLPKTEQFIPPSETMFLILL